MEEEAKLHPAAKGREEPNQNPKLNPPNRPVTSLLGLLSPWKVFNFLVWRHYKKMVITVLVHGALYHHTYCIVPLIFIATLHCLLVIIFAHFPVVNADINYNHALHSSHIGIVAKDNKHYAYPFLFSARSLTSGSSASQAEVCYHAVVV